MSIHNVLDTLKSKNHTPFVSDILACTGNTYEYELYDEDCPEEGGDYSLDDSKVTVVYDTDDGLSYVTGMFVEEGHLVLVVDMNDDSVRVSPTYKKYKLVQEHELYTLDRVRKLK